MWATHLSNKHLQRVSLLSQTEPITLSGKRKAVNLEILVSGETSRRCHNHWTAPTIRLCQSVECELKLRSELTGRRRFVSHRHIPILPSQWPRKPILCNRPTLSSRVTHTHTQDWFHTEETLDLQYKISAKLLLKTLFGTEGVLDLVWCGNWLIGFIYNITTGGVKSHSF